MNILITGCAGFIGFHLCEKLLSKKNIKIIGIDSINRYYDVKLKNKRLNILKKKNNFNFYKIDITNMKKLESLFIKNKIKYVIHLAAQAGVRYSINNPSTYFKNNIFGFYNIIEACKKYKVKHLLYASTSSVYGDTTKFPSSETDNTDSPKSFYAASKKTNEILAYSYSSIYSLPSTGLRFFTVYGSYGRPDMALFKFVKSIINNKKINVHNYGKHYRDFTHIFDVVDAIIKLIKKPSKKTIPYQIFNIGSSNPIKLMDYIKNIEIILKKTSKKKFLPLQLGDVKKTHANIKKLQKNTNFKIKYDYKKGLNEFILWYKSFYKN